MAALEMVCKKDILNGLEELGIGKGDFVFAHSSLSSMGDVEGGPDEVIDALLDSVGSSGTLAMPAFSDNMKEAFNLEITPSVTGAITERFRKRCGVFRSKHPTHSVCAYGKLAGELVRGHELCKTPCGEKSPFVKLRDWHGKILLLGVDMNRNTMLHAVEEAAGAPYLLERFEVPVPSYIQNHSGSFVTIEKMPLGHRDFLKLTPILRSRGILCEAYIGTAAAKAIPADDLFTVALDILRESPDFFLCGNVCCNSCAAARRKMGLGEGAGLFRENRCMQEYCEICSVEPEGE